MGALRAVLVPFEAINGLVLKVAIALAAFALGIMVIVVLAQVWFRYVIGTALPWPDEAARFMMLWMTGLAAPWGLRHYGFVAIETLGAALPDRGAAVLNLVFLAISMMVLILGVQLGWAHVNSGKLFASSSLVLPLEWFGGSNVKIKLMWMYLSLFVGFVLMTSVTVELIVRNVIRVAGGGDELTSLERADLPEAE